jgi:glutamate/tyrosine decarboxylase-like PLP-dependent enzyme
MSDAPNDAPARAEAHETLDPQDWDAMRRLAHRMVDDAFAGVREVRDRPAWRPMPAEVGARFDTPLPRAPEGAERAYEDYLELVSPYRMGNDHPRFWAYYLGNGTVLGALAEFVAAMDASNLGGGATGAARVEQQVTAWCRSFLGMPEGTNGLMTSGASMANLIGLAVARTQATDVDLRAEGVAAVGAPLVTYASVEVHSCHQRALELMGLGARSLRKLPVDDAFRLDLDALEAAIAEDRAAGAIPMAVVANAGSINTGSIDDLHGVADLCAREGIWFHVDAAIGAPVKLAPTLSGLVDGLERADSVALDLHKWMHMPFEAGMVLVRDEEAHRAAFAYSAAYLSHTARGLAGAPMWFHEYGPQLSRGFKALKVWMSLKEHGADRFGRLVERNIEQAQALAARLEATGQVDVLAPVVLDIVCFQVRPPGIPPSDASVEALAAFQEELLLRVQESGEAVPSNTTLTDGRTCMRVAIANHRTEDQDLERFIEVLMELACELAREPEAWRPVGA